MIGGDRTPWCMKSIGSSFTLSGGNVPAQVRALLKWYDKTVLQEARTTASNTFIIKAKAVLAL
jgi:hypothetical protein